jgi:hypothetical protein
MNYCPQRAIETAHSFFFILLFAMYIPAESFAFAACRDGDRQVIAGSGFASEVIYMILQWAVI